MEIKLRGKRGGVALVSEEDYESVSKYKWSKNKQGYVCGHVGTQYVCMHRFIMNPQLKN